MKAVVVDWLGRGGIAECTASWLMEARRSGSTELTLVTRPARFAPLGEVEIVEARERPLALLAHMEVARTAVAAIRDRRPDLVLLQNYVIPVVERGVVRAAQAVGARVVLVIHDHRLHSRLAGTHAGLGYLVRRADEVVTHSEFVATAVRNAYGRRPESVPHPMPRRLVDGPPTPPPFPAPAARLAVHFGVLKRRYKGTSVVARLAAEGVPGWNFAFLGVGAPEVRGSISVRRFLGGEDLAGAVRVSEVALLPYRIASQSGAVMLAQSLGVVPIATAVGGIPEQIEHGRTGLLVPPSASTGQWRRILMELGADRSAAIGDAARRAAQESHGRFVAWVGALTELPRSR